jgi:hypothetical protein
MRLYNSRRSLSQYRIAQHREFSMADSPSTKFFYDDPLAAAYMTKHFGMVFLSADNRPLRWFTENDNCLLDDLTFIEEYAHSYWRPVDRAYVHPDSLHLLDPQLGDWTTDEYGDIRIVKRLSGKRPDWHRSLMVSR